MRIAQVAPLTESVPPRNYGGIERVVHLLTEELVRQGHDVTLFASGDSRTTADHVAVVDESIRLSNGQRDHFIWHTLQVAEVARMADKFDVIHFHTDIFHYLLWRYIETPQVTTLHGRLDIADLEPLYEEFDDVPLVSISNAQRTPLPQARWVNTVYNGIAVDRFKFSEQLGEYLAFLGRMSPEKGPEEAIEIAKRVGIPLRMAAKVDPVDRDYFDAKVKPLLDDPLIEYLGEVDDEGKSELLAGAKGMLFPINWPEPFGLVMVESMACGTPVIAFRKGSTPEVMKEGVSGFLVDTIDQAVEAVSQLESIDRRACRQYCEDNFSVTRMTAGYLGVYRQLLKSTDRRGTLPRWNVRQPARGDVERVPPSEVRLLNQQGRVETQSLPTLTPALSPSNGRPLL